MSSNLNGYNIKYFPKIIAFITAFVIKTFWLGRVNGLSNIPQNPSVIISNHLSYLDFLLIGYVLNRKANKRFRFWAKTKVVNHSIWKFYSGIFQSIEVDCGHGFRTLYEMSQQAITDGEFVCIFPEGTRSKDGNLMPFKEGYIKLAATCSVEILPIYLENTFVAWPSHKSLPKIQRCNLTFYPALTISKDPSRMEIEQVNLAMMDQYYAWQTEYENKKK